MGCAGVGGGGWVVCVCLGIGIGYRYGYGIVYQRDMGRDMGRYMHSISYPVALEHCIPPRGISIPIR